MPHAHPGLQQTQHLGRRERQPIAADAERVMDGIGDRGHARMERPLTRLLGAVRALGIDALDDQALQLRRVECGRDAVVEQARPVVQARAVTDRGRLEAVALEQRLAEAHVGAALHLPLDRDRRERAPAIVRDPDVLDLDEAGLGIGLDLGHMRGERVGR
jgi:hypothetical protein